MHLRWPSVLILVLVLTLAAACSGDDEEDESAQAADEQTTQETVTASSADDADEPDQAAPADQADDQADQGAIPDEDEAVADPVEDPVIPDRPIADYDAAAAVITVDGEIEDWSDIPALPLELRAIDDRAGEVADAAARLRVATDGETLFVLVEVDDDYDFNLDDHHLSPALAVTFPIDADAGSAMGATEEDQETSQGLTDVWHWELDCVSGVLAGQISAAGGNDPACNLDDEWARAPEDRKDDAAETSLIGMWSHTNPVADGDGTWIFELARPLNTADPEDVQFSLGGVTPIALAYWDADETLEGWEDDGHAVSVSEGRALVTVSLPFPGETDAIPAGPSVAEIAAANTVITIDGDTSDWARVPAEAIELAAIADRAGEVGAYTGRVRMTADAENLYVLVEVDDDYDFNADDHRLSPALAVMFPIDAASGTAMGATEDDQEVSLGLVDVWHWELDCGAGLLSGLVSSEGGNDPACNLDDEWALAPEDRKDDAAETSLIGVWTHTNPVAGGEGVWVFEMARPLQTNDPEDAQFGPGSVVPYAIAYWDADETVEGWEDDGHAVTVSDDRGFLSATLPSVVSEAAVSVAETAASATNIIIDGEIADWARVPALDVDLAAIFDRSGEVGDYTSRVRVTADADTLYVLVEVDDDYDFVLENHSLSPALAVMFPIDANAGTAMGATEDDQETSQGLTDVWHWELDCGPGDLSGLVSNEGGNDPVCNLDDEWALAPEDRKDDAAETSLIGVWNHTNPVAGGTGTWIFEMSRPLQTGDPEDAQFAPGGEVLFAIAYWDPDETPEGWEDDGHAVSVSDDRSFLSMVLPN